MSREIRAVALDWEHPRYPSTYTDGSPRYRPLHKRSWLQDDLKDFEANPHDWDNVRPDPADYMPELKEGTPYGWQMYETVSEGSPVSPIFRTKAELAAWLSSAAAGRDQVSPASAAKFVEDGYAPSFVMMGGQLMSGVEAAGRWPS